MEAATDGPQRMIDEEGIEYLQISSLLPFANGYIMALNPVENIQAEINPVIRIMLVAALCLLLAVSFWMISFNHFFSAPIRMLDRISTHIQRGDLTSKPDLSGERCEEVLRIGNALNLLLDEISELKIGIYEDQITRREFELQYLKSQVAPHFLINCLSAVGSMPGTEEGHKMTQQIIQTLSNHLRYTLSERKIVPLSEELYYVENYLQLTAVRFPGYLKWEISVQEECRNASVFPVLLLMFTENMVKHNMIMGEMLNARITAVMRTENKEKYIVMTHLDSGSGYPEEMLQLFNSPVEEQQHDLDGYRMGNYNIIKRLKLMYGEMASVRFSNEAGWGAKTEISIPYRPFDFSI